jgi:ketosteroid isomerase-like protein
MISRTEALAFAQEWIAAWNAHDLPRILAHYAEDFSMSSPYIAEIAGVASGTLQGKTAVADYWRKALAKMPQLHFELIDVLLSSDSIVISYRNHAGRVAAEWFSFDAQGQVQRAAAHYSIELNNTTEPA